MNGTGRLPQHDLLIASLEGAASQLQALLDAQEADAAAWKATVIPQCIQAAAPAASKPAFQLHAVEQAQAQAQHEAATAASASDEGVTTAGIAVAGAFAVAAAVVGFVRAK